MGIYYVGRHNVDDILSPVSDDVAPYGVIRNGYSAVTAVETALYAKLAPDADSEQLVTLAADSRLSIWQIEDGWAVVPYKRVVGYLYVGEIQQLRTRRPQPRLCADGRRGFPSSQPSIRCAPPS